MKKILICLLLIIQSNSVLNCQQWASKVVRLLKNYQLDQADKYLKTHDHHSKKTALQFDIIYKKTGVIKEDLIKELLFSNKPKSVIQNYILGDYFGIKEKSDSLTYHYYQKAYKNAMTQNDTLLINESLKRLLFHYYRNGKVNRVFREHIATAKLFKKDTVDNFWVLYFETGAKLQRAGIEGHLKETTKAAILQNFEKMEQYAVHPYLKGMSNNLKGIFFDAFSNSTKIALECYDKAGKYFSASPYFYSQSKFSNTEYNKGKVYVTLKEYDKAISLFRKDLKIKSSFESSAKKTNIQYAYESLYESYDAIGKYDSAYYFIKKYRQITKEIKSEKHANYIEEEHLKKKEEKYLQLMNKNRVLQTNFLTLLPIIGIIIIVLIFIFYLYKRYRKKSNILEEEKSKTLQKLDELKSIVIKNHIILKDKTKVYIADLMYIKSDDHYLNIFTSAGKNHFVRGKLSQIKEELPPNFIQCHRSYIVNRNFIKQFHKDSLLLIDKTSIPVSRSYKDQFK